MNEVKRISWTPELDSQLVAKHEAGMPWEEVAEDLGTTVYAATKRYSVIKEPKPAPAEPASPNPEPAEQVHIPEPEQPNELYGLFVAITNHARVADFVPDHIVLDCRDGILLAIASGIGADGRCVELTLTRHTLQV